MHPIHQWLSNCTNQECSEDVMVWENSVTNRQNELPSLIDRQYVFWLDA
jgi:hypothetical protein